MIVGTEWLVEATNCNAAVLRDESVLRDMFSRIVDELDLRALGEVWYKFPGEGGVTGLVALSESHLACHTYPEHRTATFNLYCCRSRQAWGWEENLKAILGAESVSINKIERGNSNAAVPAAVARPTRLREDRADRKLVSYGQISTRERGRLPHWEADDGIYFVTFRLADSLPQHILKQLSQERIETERVLAELDRDLRAEEKRRIDWLLSEKVDAYLDKNYGSCELRNPVFAKIVADSLRHFDGDRYHLYAWCVMPNHVHTVVKPIRNHKLEEVLHSLKSYTAHEINKAIGRDGEFWQREYYDHLVRSESDLDRVVRYTILNPEKAGLQNWPWVSGMETLTSTAFS